MATDLDRDQLKAVTAERNTVVTAGAGSGKTTVLAHRFVHLIRSGRARVDGILTLTFTRKAAAEMYERIYRLLLEQSETVESPQERELLGAALKDFEKASISTLDSFCAGIVRGGSSRFGVPGDFRQDEYASEILIRETALRFLLEKSTDAAMKPFLEENGFEEVLEQLLVPLAGEELHMAEAHDFEKKFAGQLDHLRKTVDEIAVSLGETRRWFLEEDLPTDKKSLMTAREALRRIADPREAAEAGDWPALEEIASTGLRKPGNVKDPLLVEAKDLITSWQAGTGLLEPILALFLNEKLYRGMYRLLEEYQGRIGNMKRSNGILTFRDVVEMAVTLLREEPELRSFYKKKFTHIMIDEFQDNNDLQRRLLFLLAEREDLSGTEIPEPDQLKPDKLFFVGDEKQSIYRFRGADVRVLKQLQGQIRDSGGETLQLPRNYRSHSELIAFFNRLFSSVMGDGAGTGNVANEGTNEGTNEGANDGTGSPGAQENPPDPREDFEAEFVPLESPVTHEEFVPDIHLLYQPFRKETAENEDDEPAGTDETVDTDGEEVFLSTAEAEAWAIVSFIRDRVGTGSLKVRDGLDDAGRPRLRQASYDDVAILMRSSSNQIHLEKYLRRLRIPYTVQSIRSLFQDAPVNDIYQMLQLLVYPRDLTAYTALLRSPFVHLSDELVGRIILETRDRQGEVFSHSGEEDFFQDPEEQEKYLHAAGLYRELREKAVARPVAELVRRLWYEGGYRYVVLRDPDYHRYLEFYDALIALARLSDSRGRNLALFLDFLRENLGDYKKLEDLEMIPRSSRGVQLLSIHKSKGLEFPVVILADMGNTGGGGRTRLYDWNEDFGLVFNIAVKKGKSKKSRRNYFSETSGKRRKKEDAAELKRLLYVGCTRAEDHLVLAGSHHSKNKKIKTDEGQTALLNLVLEAFGWDGESPVIDMAGPLGCTVLEIPEVRLDEVQRRSSSSKSRPLEQVRALMENTPHIVRDIPQREWNATELNLLYRQEIGDDGTTEDDGMIVDDGTIEDGGLYGGASAEKPHASAVPVLPVLKKIDPLLRGSREAMAFGDMVHAAIEYGVKGFPGKPPLPGTFIELEGASIEALDEAARTVAESFFSTPLGEEVRAAARAGLVESELPFLLRLDGTAAAGDSGPAGTFSPEQHLVRGQIDLLLQREKEIVVVDFKTDRDPHPEGYAVQMALYRKAASELFGKPSRSILVYVRSGELHEVDTEIDLEGLVNLR